MPYKDNAARNAARKARWERDPEAHAAYLARLKKWREENRESIATTRAAFYRAHHAKWRARAKGYRAKNLDKARADCRAWYAKNKDAQREYEKRNKSRRDEVGKKWREKNRNRLRENNHRHRAAHPGIAVEYEARRRARKVGAGGTGWTRADVRAQLAAQKGRCFYCNRSVGNSFHCDHVIPLALGGAHCRSNLVIACPRCNQTKSARHPQEFAGLLL